MLGCLSTKMESISFLNLFLTYWLFSLICLEHDQVCLTRLIWNLRVSLQLLWLPAHRYIHTQRINLKPTLVITDLLFRSTVTMSRHATLTWHMHTTQFVASVGFYPHTKNQRCTLILQSSNMTVSNILKSDCSKPFRNFQFRQTFNLWWKVKSYKNFQMTKYRTPYFVILCLNIRAKMNFQPKLDFVSFYILK